MSYLLGMVCRIDEAATPEWPEGLGYEYPTQEFVVADEQELPTWTNNDQFNPIY